MTEADRSLFSRALYEAFSERIAEDISECKKITPTKRHARVVKAIIKDEKIISLRNKKIPLRLLVAAAIIVALLLSGCAATMLYRNELKTFFEEFYSDHITIDFNKDNTNASSKNPIETYYELAYIPEGYYITLDTRKQTYAYTHYQNEKGDTIQLNQNQIGSTGINLDNEFEEKEIITVGDTEIYYYNSDGLITYLWSDSTSIIELMFFPAPDVTETRKVLEGVVVKKISEKN